MKTIPLTKGQETIVDDEDFEDLSAYHWCAMKGRHNLYAVRASVSASGKRSLIRLHRQLLNAPVDMLVDHINGDGLDNRRQNLRLCTNRQNQQNQRWPRRSLSRFKGVTYDKRSRKWPAYIKTNGRMRGLGYFSTELEAAMAYNAAALVEFGEFAALNILEEQEPDFATLKRERDELKWQVEKLRTILDGKDGG
jgi:HNH endonuclease